MHRVEYTHLGEILVLLTAAAMEFRSDLCPTCVKTESIKYAGSKLRILPFIFEAISGLEVGHVLDGFSGSTRVSQAFAKNGFRVTSNDVAIWSETMAKAYLLNARNPDEYSQLMDHLNGLRGYSGWFSEHYGGVENGSGKKPFQLRNTMKLDAIRDEIERLQLDEITKAVALTSLILALDAVDSTLGHQVSYLAQWSPRSYREMVLKVPALISNVQQHEVLRGDVFESLLGRSYDLVYYDPPYGSNNEKMPASRVRYNSYYHIWTSVILNDRPRLFGKVNRREDSRDEVSASVFEEFRKDENGHFIAMQAIRRLIHATDSRYVLLSYSSGGRATKEELYDIIHSAGKLIRTMEIDHRKNVMGQMRWTNTWINSDGTNKEYLFLMERR